MGQIKKFTESIEFIDAMGKSPEKRLLMEIEGYYDAIQHNLNLIIDEYAHLANGNDTLIQELISDLEKVRQFYDMQWIIDRAIEDLKNQ